MEIGVTLGCADQEDKTWLIQTWINANGPSSTELYFDVFQVSGSSLERGSPDTTVGRIITQQNNTI